MRRCGPVEGSGGQDLFYATSTDFRTRVQYRFSNSRCSVLVRTIVGIEEHGE